MTDTTTAASEPCQAVGAPVEQPVRPAAWMLRSLHDRHQKPWPTAVDSDAYRLAAKRADFECAPLYDKATFEAAVATERAESARLRHLLNLARDDYNTAAQRLQDIGDYAHDHSTGPAVPDALWEVRSMAYGSGA